MHGASSLTRSDEVVRTTWVCRDSKTEPSPRLDRPGRLANCATHGLLLSVDHVVRLPLRRLHGEAVPLWAISSNDDGLVERQRLTFRIIRGVVAFLSLPARNFGVAVPVQLIVRIEGNA